MTQADLPEAAQAAALTDALRESGVLAGGRVSGGVLENDRKTVLSRILRLRLNYDGPAGEAPDTLIFKTGLPRTMAPSWRGGRQEVAFYTDVAPRLPDGVVPRCFGARWDGATGAWHLLLQDLTDSHVIATEWPLPPTQAQCETILAAHARLHAALWDDPGLGVAIGTWPDAEPTDQFTQRLQHAYRIFADRLGDNLSAEQRLLYERFLDAVPRLFARCRTHRGMAVVQGDSHVWNCFLPRNDGAAACLFDWDCWRVHVPATDLAYMMALHWYPDRRRRMERPLLDHYHRVLLVHGVSGYDRPMLDEDYRWAVLTRMAVPPMQAAVPVPPAIWWHHTERILMAVDDLGCRELLA